MNDNPDENDTTQVEKQPQDIEIGEVNVNASDKNGSVVKKCACDDDCLECYYCLCLIGVLVGLPLTVVFLSMFLVSFDPDGNPNVFATIMFALFALILIVSLCSFLIKIVIENFSCSK